MDNTVENMALLDKETLLCVTYGLQIAIFDLQSKELIYLNESLSDFPKGIATIQNNDQVIVAIGGRGGYVSVFQFNRKNNDITFDHILTIWIPGTQPVLPKQLHSSEKASTYDAENNLS